MGRNLKPSGNLPFRNGASGLDEIQNVAATSSPCLHLLHGDVVGNERRLHLDAELLEDDRPGIGGRRALGIEVHHLAGEVLERLDLGPHEHVRLRGEQVQQVVDAPPGVGELGLGLEVVEHVAVDDGRIDAAQVEQVVDVVEGPARDDRQHAHVVAVVEHAGELGGELQRRAFEAAGGEPDRPGVDAVLVRLLDGRRRRAGGRPAALGACATSIACGAGPAWRARPTRCGGACAWAAERRAEDRRAARPATTAGYANALDTPSAPLLAMALPDSRRDAHQGLM